MQKKGVTEEDETMQAFAQTLKVERVVKKDDEEHRDEDYLRVQRVALMQAGY